VFVGVSLSGAGSGATSVITNTIEAGVSGGSVTSAADKDIDILAKDNSYIASFGGALAVGIGIAIGSVGGAVGVSVGSTDIGNTVRAKIDNATVTASGDLKVKAEATSNIRAEAIAYATGAGTGAFGAGAAITTNMIHNTVEARIKDADEAGGQEAKGDLVSVQASDSSKIDSNSFGGALSIGGVGFSVGAVLAENAIGGSPNLNGQFAASGGGPHTVRALIENSKVTATEGNVEVKSTSSGILKSTATGGAISVSGGASGAFGIVYAANVINGTTVATVSSSKVTSNNGAVEVLASSEGSITSTPVAFAAAVSGGGGLSGAGVLATNSITPTTSATVVSSSTVNAGTHIKLEAKDLSTIDATILAVSLSVGTNGLAAGVSLADNTAGGTITAATSNSTLTASGGALDGNIDILASANQTVTTFASALSLSIGFIASISGAGATTDETINPNVTASNTGGTLTANGNMVNIHASFTGNSDPQTTAGTVSVSPIGGAFSIVKADALISGTTSAFSAGGTINASGLDIDATDNSTVTSFALSIGVSTGLSISTVMATATLIARHRLTWCGILNTNGGR
jgi:hypothetical protein